MNFKLIFAAAALFATQAFAIAGIGAHYTPNVGTTLKKADRTDFDGMDGKLGFSHGNFTSIHGFGFKVWVDLLPFIDVEGSFNIQFASYNAALWTYDLQSGEPQKHNLEIELGGTPFAKATPKYIAMNGDVSVTYPISIPLFPIRPYVGGGLTMHLNTFILNKQFVNKAIDYLKEKGEFPTDGDMEQIAKKLGQRVVDMAKDEGLNKSVGFHLLAGVRFKLPIIPIAAYANAKCYFGGEYDADIDPGHFAFEIGGGFAL